MASFASRFEVRSRMDLLSRGAVESIHSAGLRILETVGVRVDSSVARAALRSAGAAVDEKTGVVRLPGDLVGSLVSKVPREFVLAGREREFDLPVDGKHCYFTTDGCGISVWDHVTGTRRRSVLEDVRRTARLCDWLPYVSIYEPMVVAHDVPQEKHVVAGVKVSMENTTKHITTESTSNPAEAAKQVEMAAEVVGGKDELKKRHYLSAMVCTVSPLILDGPATDAAMVWAENHVPVHITGMAQMGTSGPPSMAADLALNHAETLAMACVIEAREPGAPCLYGSVLASVDPVTGAYAGGAPESILLCCAAIQIGRHCGFPTMAGGLGSGAKHPGVRAVLENTHSAALCVATGGEVINGLGMLDGSTVLSYEQLVWDHEAAGMALRICGGLDVSQEELLEPLIKEVGIGGSYLAKRKTAELMRGLYNPTAWPHGRRTEQPLPDSPDSAVSMVDEVLRKHTPNPLDAELARRLDLVSR